MQDNEAGSSQDGAVTGRGDPLGNHSEIGRKLREYYNDLVSDAVPDRFSQLLSELERSEGANGGKG